MICLDTTFLIDLFKERIKIDDELKELLKEELVITPFSILELYHGMYRLKNKRSRIQFPKKRKKDSKIL